MSGLGFVNKLIYLGNFIAAALLLSSYAAPYTDPNSFWAFSLSGLAYPILVFANLGFIAWWFFQKKKHWLLSLVILLLGYSFLSKNFGFGGRSPSSSPDEQSLTFMTYNVKNFDLYNWKENEASRDAMLEIIKTADPDIITFQEFYSQEDQGLQNINRLVNDLGYEDYYFEKTLTHKGGKHWGMATFSRYPIINQEKIDFPNSRFNLSTVSDIQISNKIYRVFNVHLQSFHFGKTEYDFIENIGKEGTPDIRSSKNLLRKLRDAYLKRSEQTKLLSKAIGESEHPVFVAGDFNDTPVSYAYRELSHGLKDAFVEAGRGIGNTYSGPIPCPLRIDYILTDPSTSILSYEVIKAGSSDHYPIVAEVNIPLD